MPRDRYGRPIQPEAKGEEKREPEPEGKERAPEPDENKRIEPNYSRKRH